MFFITVNFCLKGSNMNIVSFIIPIAVIVLGLFILIKLLFAPIKLIFKLLLNALTGFLILILVDIVGGFFDFSLPLSLFNVLIAGGFGIPGVLFLILINLL